MRALTLIALFLTACGSPTEPPPPEPVDRTFTLLEVNGQPLPAWGRHYTRPNGLKVLPVLYHEGTLDIRGSDGAATLRYTVSVCDTCELLSREAFGVVTEGDTVRLGVIRGTLDTAGASIVAHNDTLVMPED